MLIEHPAEKLIIGKFMPRSRVSDILSSVCYGCGDFGCNIIYTAMSVSLFHDDDGRKYIVALKWETRTEYEKPGPINIIEYDPVSKKVIGMSRRFWHGGTDRGCIEALVCVLPSHNDFDSEHWLLCAADRSDELCRSEIQTGLGKAPRTGVRLFPD